MDGDVPPVTTNVSQFDPLQGMYAFAVEAGSVAACSVAA